jgi:hypothetical protein
MKHKIQRLKTNAIKLARKYKYEYDKFVDYNDINYDLESYDGYIDYELHTYISNNSPNIDLIDLTPSNLYIEKLFYSEKIIKKLLYNKVPLELENLIIDFKSSFIYTLWNSIVFELCYNYLNIHEDYSYLYKYYSFYHDSFSSLKKLKKNCFHIIVYNHNSNKCILCEKTETSINKIKPNKSTILYFNIKGNYIVDKYDCFCIHKNIIKYSNMC